MLRYDEPVTLIDSEGKELGRCRMLAWVLINPNGLISWRGEFQEMPGESFDFIDAAIGKNGLQVRCEDSTSARVLVRKLSVGTSGSQCTFDGNGAPPRPTS